MSKSYSTNLTQDQWELIEPLIPPPLSGGRLLRSGHLGSTRAQFFMLIAKGVDGVLTLATSPTGKQCIRLNRNWRRSDGTWVRIHDRLREWTRVDNEREPSPHDAPS